MPRRRLDSIPCEIENARFYYDKGVRAGIYLASVFSKKKEPLVRQKKRVLSQLKSLYTVRQLERMTQREIQNIARDNGLTGYSDSKTNVLPRLIPLLRQKKLIRPGS